MRPTVVALLLVCAGCGAKTDPHLAIAADLEAGVRALNRGVGLSSGLVASGVVNTAAPPDVIASSIYQRTQTESGGCIKGTRNGAEIDLDFGTGCTLATAGMVLTGPVKAVVSTDPLGGDDITLTLTGNSVDGQPISGNFKILTTDGNLFSYAASLVLGDVQVNAPNLMAGIASGGATLDGNGTLTGPSAAGIAGGWQLTMVGLHEVFSGCYPDDGTAALAGGGQALTFSFDSSVPGSGQVSLAAGGTAAPIALPSRMGCPAK
ncbi:MAG: hypothetical protein ACHQ17_06560 [Polyangia bacterium]